MENGINDISYHPLNKLVTSANSGCLNKIGVYLCTNNRDILRKAG